MTERREVAPNFFVLGAAKCGTTTLHHLLIQHPAIYLPEEKEPRFFDDEQHYRLGFESYLETYFRGAGGHPARGEATPSYLSAADLVAPRMRRHLGGDLRFIVILRDPVRRLWSHYLHQRRRLVETLSLERALLREMEGREDAPPWTRYFADGEYARQLEAWFRHYPRERFCFVFTEELREAPVATVRRLYRFLGVDDAFEPQRQESRNRAAAARSPRLARMLNRPGRLLRSARFLLPYRLRKRLRDWLNERNVVVMERPPEIDAGLARLLRRWYEPDVLRLQEIVGRDLSAWLETADEAPPAEEGVLGELERARRRMAQGATGTTTPVR